MPASNSDPMDTPQLSDEQAAEIYTKFFRGITTYYEHCMLALSLTIKEMIDRRANPSVFQIYKTLVTAVYNDCNSFDSYQEDEYSEGLNLLRIVSPIDYCKGGFLMPERLSTAVTNGERLAILAQTFLIYIVYCRRGAMEMIRLVVSNDMTYEHLQILHEVAHEMESDAISLLRECFGGPPHSSHFFKEADPLLLYLGSFQAGSNNSDGKSEPEQHREDGPGEMSTLQERCAEGHHIPSHTQSSEGNEEDNDKHRDDIEPYGITSLPDEDEYTAQSHPTEAVLTIYMQKLAC